jgi:hypothetical protein
VHSSIAYPLIVNLLAVLRRSHNLFTRSRLFIANP